MAKYVGIDFGSRSVKIVVVDGGRKRFSLTHFAEREIPVRLEEGTDCEEAAVQAIESMLTEMRLPRERVAVSISAQDCFFREFYVPFTSADQIDKIIKFETENYIPSTPVEELIIDYYPIEVEEARTKVLVVACPKERVSRILRILDRCEVDPTLIGLDITSMYATCRGLNLIDEQTTAVLVDLGAHAMKIGLVEMGKLVHIRTPRVGTDFLIEEPNDESELDDLENLDFSNLDVGQLDFKELENELIVSLSTFDESEHSRAQSTAAEETIEGPKDEDRLEILIRRVIREIVRTLAGRRLKSQPTILYLAGGGSVLSDLVERLAEKLQVSVMPVDVLQKIRHGLNGVDPAEFNHSLPVGVGLGLRQMGLEFDHFDFRQEEFRFTGVLEQFKLPVAVALTGLFVLLLGLTYVMRERLSDLYEVNNAFVKSAHAPYYDVCGQKYDPDELKSIYDANVQGQKPHLALRAVYDTIQQVVEEGQSGRPEQISILVLLAELFSQFLKTTDNALDEQNKGGKLEHLSLERIEIKSESQSIQIKGKIDNTILRAKLKQCLAQSKYFGSVSAIGDETSEEYPSQFHLKFKYYLPSEISDEE